MTVRFVLRRGGPAPQQSTTTTCGSSCLVVARMLADPRYAGQVHERGFGVEELAVRARTNRLHPSALRLQLPWPRALGTPPWGAALELARGLRLPRRSVGWRVVRWSSRAARAALVERLSSQVTSASPVLLYVGSRLLPRHVTLLLPAADGDGLDVYEPSAGVVEQLDLAGLVAGRVDLGGWRTPWLVVGPREVIG
ncbi:hypothetical protein [Arsenicicoccus sp. oral taxon 190]|uniref:hypothetical protein n=1 Tax=Arsenicicoccus sp. oral taxon 190 TaxID=1658671 RepID=UPI00067A1580|nr:hypothetical protein [Arsenicicoccus sp. oral taxon 190]AKT51528.1 hypothetical protein ADJ73_09795 [Arsenicicoccus sp. oral taxon 190]